MRIPGGAGWPARAGDFSDAAWHSIKYSLFPPLGLATSATRRRFLDEAEHAPPAQSRLIAATAVEGRDLRSKNPLRAAIPATAIDSSLNPHALSGHGALPKDGRSTAADNSRLGFVRHAAAVFRPARMSAEQLESDTTGRIASSTVGDRSCVAQQRMTIPCRVCAIWRTRRWKKFEPAAGFRHPREANRNDTSAT